MARIFFQLKVGIYDLKSFRPFQYDDLTCRLCKADEETLDHAVNWCENNAHCPPISVDIHNISGDEIRNITERLKAFREKVSDSCL